MKILTTAILTIIFASCTPMKLIPLKGNYVNTPYQFVSDKPKDKVWDNIIDFFAQKGLSIKLIDRSSGLIVSEKTGLTFTHEDKTGQLVNKGAWAVIPKIWSPGQNKYISLYTTIMGDWNIRIKELETGKTSINVNLVNITGLTSSYSLNTGPNTIIDAGKSTGVFEEMIAVSVK